MSADADLNQPDVTRVTPVKAVPSCCTYRRLQISNNSAQANIATRLSAIRRARSGGYQAVMISDELTRYAAFP